MYATNTTSPIVSEAGFSLSFSLSCRPFEPNWLRRFGGGIFGIGGGAVLVPVLYECFRIAGVPLDARMPLCIGTSLAIIIPTSIRSWQAHRKRGSVDMDILLKWALPVLLGVILGSVIARYAPEKLFKVVFVGVAWTAAARLLLGKGSWRLGDARGSRPAQGHRAGCEDRWRHRHTADGPARPYRSGLCPQSFQHC